MVQSDRSSASPGQTVRLRGFVPWLRESKICPSAQEFLAPEQNELAPEADRQLEAFPPPAAGCSA